MTITSAQLAELARATVDAARLLTRQRTRIDELTYKAGQ